MKILGFETTGDVCSVGIMDENRITAEISLFDKNTHSVNLMPMIDACLKLAKMTIDDIDAVAVGIGPGSFTGIRIGVCTAKGLALKSEKPCIAVNTLDALGFQAIPFMGLICPLIDARRAECYFSLFSNDVNGIARIRDYGADRLDVFLKTLPEEPICFIGDGAETYRDAIKSEVGARAVFMPEANIRQHVRGVLLSAGEKAARGEFVSVYDLSPYYHRISQAERMKEQHARA